MRSCLESRPTSKGFTREVPLPRRTLSPQKSFFDPEFVMPNCLEKGTVQWLLARYRSRLFPAWLFRGWRGEGRRGRKAWPAPLLMTLLLLRWSEVGISRLGSAKRARFDVSWRGAMGLHTQAPTPTEKTLREFEAFMRERHPGVGTRRYMLLHEHVIRLCCEQGLVDDAAVWTMDSTPMWCYGAVKDTVRLLGDGVRKLAKEWSKASRESLEDIADAWEVPFILGKSTKGALKLDWRDTDARANALDMVARGVLRATQSVRSRLQNVGAGKRKRLLRRCRHLVRVVRGDLETDTCGRLVIATQVARNRLISLTDPEARHGRKSKKRTFNGYKIHLLGDVVSGLITAVIVTMGNTGDNTVAHRLIRRAKKVCEDLEQVLGDTAYGAAELRHNAREDIGVSILSPPPAYNRKPFGRDSIHINFEAQTATCAAGVTSELHRRIWSKEHDQYTSTFRWSKYDCKSCEYRQSCCGKRQGGKYVRLHPYEQELRDVRSQWEKPEIREAYRTRSQCERLVNQVTRHGGRQARSFGLQAAHLQAHAISITCNLQLLARILAANT